MSLPATVYILANDKHLVYIGYTKDLEFALYMARNEGLYPVQKQLGATNLVYFEQHGTVKEAIARVEELESWSLAKTQSFVEEANPNWIDLGIKASQVPAGALESPLEYIKQIAQHTEKLRAEELYQGPESDFGGDPASGGIAAKLPTGPKPPVKSGHDAKLWPTETEE